MLVQLQQLIAISVQSIGYWMSFLSARPTVILPDAQHHHSLAGTNYTF